MGKMGRSIADLASINGFEVKVAVNSLEQLVQSDLSNLDIVIEFTNPRSAKNNISHCLRLGIPIVSGTTGWLEGLEEVKKLCSEMNGTFLYASNFSIGMNMVFELNRIMANWMNQFDEFQMKIEETHHVQKLDKPSGTAKTLADDLVRITDRLDRWALTSDDQIHGSDVIPVHSYRKGDVKGTHRISFDSPSEMIRIDHEAKDRDVFAHGALMAARWLVGKTGVYTFSDLLKFEASNNSR